MQFRVNAGIERRNRTMDTFAYHLIRQPLAWIIAINVLALGAFAVSPHASEFPLALVGIQVFILVQVFLPACRPVATTSLCPGNVAQAFFWVQLVLVPILFGFSGLSQGTLPRMPSAHAINTAIGIHLLAYVCFCIAYHHAHQSLAATATNPEIRNAPYGLIVPFLVVGLVGFFLAYGSVGGYVEYISSPVLQKEREQQATTLDSAISTFLRPFLGFTLVLVWSAWIERQARGFALATAGTAVLAVALVFANFSYNRGSVLAPLIGVGAAYSLHVRRIALPTVAVAAALALIVALAFGSYRSTEQRITDLSTDEVQDTVSSTRLVDFVQIYASGPQMMGYLIEELDTDNTFYWGKTLVPSLVHTIPVLGKPFRPDSGVTILNMLIYDDPEIVDQNIPYDAEFYMNFHLPGVVVGYALLGLLIAFFQTQFMRAGHAVESYLWFLMGLWTVFPGSLPVLSQIAVYFFWPSYIYLAVRLLLSGERYDQTRGAFAGVTGAGGGG